MEWEYLTVTFFKVGVTLVIDAEGSPQRGKLVGQIEGLSNRQQVLDLVGKNAWELVSVNVLGDVTLMYTFKRKVS